jgi:hypothetical protein
MSRKAKILVMGSDLIVIGILSLLLFNLISIPLFSPDGGAYTTDRKPEFSWGGMQGEYVILLADNPKFASPVTENVSGNSYKMTDDLDFGTYYWKVESGPFSSGVGKFTVGSLVMLSRSENSIKNEGNADLKIGGITGFFILGVNKSVEIKGEENVRAEQA